MKQNFTTNIYDVLTIIVVRREEVCQYYMSVAGMFSDIERRLCNSEERSVLLPIDSVGTTRNVL